PGRADWIELTMEIARIRPRGPTKVRSHARAGKVKLHCDLCGRALGRGDPGWVGWDSEGRKAISLGVTCTGHRPYETALPLEAFAGPEHFRQLLAEAVKFDWPTLELWTRLYEISQALRNLPEIVLHAG